MGTVATGRPKWRPPVDIDWDMVDELVEGGTPGTEVAWILGISSDTLYRRCQSDMGIGFTEYYQQMRSRGNSKLHKKQFDVALEGNTSMLTHLGKWRLGQKEEDKPQPTPSQVGSADSAMLSGTFKALLAQDMSIDDALSLINDVLTALPNKVAEFKALSQAV